MRIKHALSGALVVSAALALPAVAGAAVGLPPSASEDLRGAVEAADLRPYLVAIEDISLHHGFAGTTAADGHAADGDGEFRQSGTEGAAQTVQYIRGQLEAAGLDPTVQSFPFAFFKELADPVAEFPPQVARASEFSTMSYSGSGDVTGTIVPTLDIVDPPGPTASTSHSGCTADDFAPAPDEPAIALIQRGTCTFAEKALAAQAAGYDAAIIFNEGQEGRTETLNGTLGGTGVTIPVLGASWALGKELYDAATAPGGATARIVTQTVSENRTGYNVVATTPTGRSDRVVLAGAHTDSTSDGPAVNDDGTGVALLLGTAKAFDDQGIAPRNRVRFGFWGAEEEGLVGSAYYASQLSSSQTKNIAVNLAFDMLASDNAARLVYDGDGSATGVKGPNGSGTVEGVFTRYYGALGLPTDPTELDGRTDYASFTDLGIPAGGITGGAEVPKTDEQQVRYGGVAGQPYYVCYHEACDTVATIFGSAGAPFSPLPEEPELQAFVNAGLGAATLTDQAGGAAHAILTFAETTSAVNGTDKASSLAKAKQRREFLGSRLRK